jgi:hypothetical protein
MSSFGPMHRLVGRSGPRAAGAASLIIAAIMAAACSSGSKAASAPPATTPASTAAAGGSTTTGSGACRTGGTSPGASGSGDVAVPGDIPDNQAYVAYQSPDGYRISVPEGWARSETARAVSFTDKFNSIRVQVSSAPSAPSLASAQSTEVPALAASAPCFQAGNVTQVSRKAGPAVLITYRADSPADAVTGKVVHQDVERYEFWQAAKLAVITLSAPQGSDNVDPWRKVTDSFGWGP